MSDARIGTQGPGGPYKLGLGEALRELDGRLFGFAPGTGVGPQTTTEGSDARSTAMRIRDALCMADSAARSILERL
jgi:hypothetical protein